MSVDNSGWCSNLHWRTKWVQRSKFILIMNKFILNLKIGFGILQDDSFDLMEDKILQWQNKPSKRKSKYITNHGKHYPNMYKLSSMVYRYSMLYFENKCITGIFCTYYGYYILGHNTSRYDCKILYAHDMLQDFSTRHHIQS